MVVFAIVSYHVASVDVIDCPGVRGLMFSLGGLMIGTLCETTVRT